MNDFNFSAKLRGSRDWSGSYVDTIQSLLPGCESVKPCNRAKDRGGADFVASIGGELLNIDAKTRDSGCSRYWRSGPELAIEYWSACPEYKNETHQDNKPGWTFDPAKSTNYILYVWEPQDSKDCYLVPIIELSKLASANRLKWADASRLTWQSTNRGRWYSACSFVPAREIVQKIRCLEGHSVYSSNRPDAPPDPIELSSPLVIKCELPKQKKVHWL